MHITIEQLHVVRQNITVSSGYIESYSANSYVVSSSYNCSKLIREIMVEHHHNQREDHVPLMAGLVQHCHDDDV